MQRANGTYSLVGLFEKEKNEKRAIKYMYKRKFQMI